jgi:hypothetical protein
LLIVLASAPVNLHAQLLQLVPSTHTDRAPQSFLDACMNVGRWPTLYARTTYLGAVSWQLRPDRASNAVLESCFAQMNVRDLRLSLEVGITGVVATGGEAYQIEWPEWQRYLDLGAPLGALFIDEPLTNGTRLQGLSYDAVVSETVNWIVLVRQNSRGANLKLVLIEAYPHITASTIVNFITDVDNGASLHGVAGLDGIQIDHAWDGRNEWSGLDLGNIHAAAHKRRMQFSLIFYAAMPFQNPSVDCDFQDRLYQQWNTYEVNGIDYYGFYPDIYTIQSWDQLPSATIPESANTCTFMQGAKHWLDTVNVVAPFRPGDYQQTRCEGLRPCDRPAVR